ncbi:protein affecting phage T7 exclusion by the F plasmid [Schinkia azotoformans MEV2011]|uniref:Protein affecting phage T7 exclusion by the F plasmid n=1 Tax=Schinkia azotoformans MEV2011 TaxID=1348973 RepID=A0A072NQS2_SCHAZ|nr:FxsA family protein [Schinkia azotoformans]KEF39572.1 protein affecting phage T7 exclusion by the F plasmid [Schinkia azotoformans MEV2011]MEC1694262.1 membrane protein FxsA [Schinkia azotoformans]MEC1714937.1 membrane protein FxsA [Schinkia azotoformans]MEC1723524.1 membrane protein FxsA [Schinkia azotoformans]MEC1742874.1 membrane protein FxsA [Schinkia azotoformans]
MRLLILLLILVPALEISVLVLSGNTIGFLPTIVLMVATSFIGAWLAKTQGLKAFRDAQTQMSYGQLPGESILDGICILIGGLLLLTPGFISDLFGIVLLLPATRVFFKNSIKKWLEKKLRNGQFYIIRR